MYKLRQGRSKNGIKSILCGRPKTIANAPIFKNIKNKQATKPTLETSEQHENMLQNSIAASTGKVIEI